MSPVIPAIADDRLIQITYPGTGNNSEFSYDGLGRCAKIVEVTSGSTTSTRQFLWCGTKRCEARDASSAVTAQYFSRGESISGTSYYWTKDHLGSIAEMSNGAGTRVWQQSFDPYGVPTTLVNSTPADMGYAGYYLHSRSGLNLTRTRSYDPDLGRFISRDPAGEFIWGRRRDRGKRHVRHGRFNLYAYVTDNPLGFRDPSGRFGELCIDDPDPPRSDEPIPFTFDPDAPLESAPTSDDEETDLQKQIRRAIREAVDDPLWVDDNIHRGRFVDPPQVDIPHTYPNQDEPRVPYWYDPGNQYNPFHDVNYGLIKDPIA